MNSVDDTHPLDGLLYDQTNLARLCAERPLDWDEYAHMSEFHGNASVLKRYAGLPLDMPLPFALEHAIPYDLDQAYEYDVNCALPMFLAVHEHSAALYRRGGIPDVRAIGFSYHYALELFHRLHPQEPERVRKGTLVFPDKSTLLMDTDFDRAAFAKRLYDLPPEFHPVVVCVYWRDYLRGQHLPFVDAGLRVVSCGHLREPDFMLRLHDLCRRFRYSCANDLAGSFTLSILSGCHFFHLPTKGLVQKKHGVTSELDHDPTLDKPDKTACILASPFPPADPAMQRALADDLSGRAFIRTVEELRTMHEQARRMLGEKIAPGEISFDGTREDREKLHRLLPAGIDFDGWTKRECRLHIVYTGPVGRLMFQLGFATPLESRTVRVQVNGGESCEIALPRLEHHLPVIIPDDAPTCEIFFSFSHEDVLPGEKRSRACRIMCLHLLEREARAVFPPAVAQQARTETAKPPVPSKQKPASIHWLRRLFHY